MADVAMPRLSDSMEEGTILKWLKSDGEEVKRGDELVEIETDKANMTYEADSDGVLSIVAQEGDTLPVGDPIARIGAAGETGGDSPAPAAEAQDTATDGTGDEVPTRAQPAPPQAAPTISSNGRSDEAPAPRPGPAGEPAPAAANGGGARVKASPIARRMARERGIELTDVTGTGPGGRILKADVQTAERDGGGATVQAPGAAPAAPQEPVAREQEAPPAPLEEVQGDATMPDVPALATAGDGGTAKGRSRREQLSRLQQTVARRMAESKATTPDFQLTVEVDMEAVVKLGKELRAAAGDAPAPSFNDFVVKSAALALRDFPRVNGSYRDGEFELYSRVNIGIAVAGEDTLVVPTIFDADSKTLGAIAADARTLAGRARAGALTPPELAGGTFSISNLGMYGIKRFVAVINPPQAAILAVGAIEPRPVVREGRIVARTMMDLTISCDHRILNGADGAEFVVRVKERLEQPLGLLL